MYCTNKRTPICSSGSGIPRTESEAVQSMTETKEQESRNRRILAVVVTYNRLHLLKECIRKLRAQTVPCDLLIVDNHSQDGTGDYVRGLASEGVKYLDTGANLGGAGGFNYGMKAACVMDCDAVWIMDDDCFPEPDALEKLLEAERIVGGRDQYGFLSSAVLWTDGHECCMNRQRIIKAFYRHVEWMKHGIIQIDQATFVSLLIPVSVIRKVGLPIREYFIWGDDIEYTRRIAMRAGLPSYLAGQSQVIHAMRENVGSDVAADQIGKLPRYRLAVRNEYYTYCRQGVYGFLLYHFRWARAFFRVLLHAKDHRLKRLGTILLGMVQGLFFHPRIEYPENPSGKTDSLEPPRPVSGISGHRI